MTDAPAGGPTAGPTGARSWADYGDRHGVPVLYFHGTPGSRVEARILAPAAARAGVRVLAVDRPGLGHAPPRPGRRVEDWPARVVEVAGRAGLERFGVLGWSGGGPYVLACVAAIPERLTAAALLAPAGPGQGSGVDGWLAAASRSVLADLAGVPGLAAAAGRGAALAHLVPALRGRVPAPRVARTLVEGVRHALANGPAGWSQDARAIGQDWGGVVGAARAAVARRAAAGDPLPVTVWHGTRDRSVPVAEGRRLARAVGARLVEDPEAGHVGVLVRHAEEVVDFLRAGAQ